MPARVVFLYDDVALSSAGASIFQASSVDLDFPAANILNPDRKVRTRTTVSPGSGVDYYIDLGAGFNAGPLAPMINGGIGIHDLQTDAPYGQGPNVEIYGGNSFASLGLLLTLSGLTYWHKQRDWVETFASGNQFRYFQVRMLPQNYRFSLGKVIIGSASAFAYLYSPGSEFRWVVPTADTQTEDFVPVQTVAGDERKRFRLSYSEVDDVDRLVLERIGRQRKPMSMIDSVGASNHVLLLGANGTPFGHQFGVDPAIWTIGLELEQIP